MKLVDFSGFKPCNALRNQMKAPTVNYEVEAQNAFELTDREIHVLKTHGLQIPSQQLKILSDDTFCYKNSRVLVIDPGAGDDAQDGDEFFHIAHCPRMEKSLKSTEKQALKLFIVATSTNSWWFQQVKQQYMDRKVCDVCLQHIRYLGYDNVRQRKKTYSSSVLKNFSVEAFFEHYSMLVKSP